MPWRCFIVRRLEHGFLALDGRGFDSEDQLPIGACWQGPDSHEFGVKLPGLGGFNRFCPAAHNTWEIGGEWPTITVHPNINAQGQWHGTITDGVISDDIDGRKYNLTGLRKVKV